MNISSLRNFCTEKHSTLIELYKNGERWLFATDGHRAIGFRTHEFASNIEESTSGKTSCIKDLLEANREFKPLRPQKFMVFLHLLEDEDKECSVCDGSGRVPCPDCDGKGSIECLECEGCGNVYSDCEECDGTGKEKCDCEECDGTGKENCECEECSGSGKHKDDCDECGGSGFEDDEETKKCSACTGGKVESGCEYCTDGVIENDCINCEEGQVEHDCEHCEDGRVERECEECDCGSGSVECHTCDFYEDHTVECSDCDEEKKDTGVIYNKVFDLGLLKDLSMDYFEEISPSHSDGEPLVVRGQGVQAFIMPMRKDPRTIYDRTYCP